MRWMPLILLLALVVMSAARALLHRRATGINPYVMASGDSPEGYVGRALRWVMGGLFAALIAHAMGRDSSLGILPWAGEPIALWFGAMLAVVSLTWSAVGQAQMGRAWRIGIDHTHATALVRHGLFAVSRNPIFLGVRVGLVGVLLLAPNAVVLATVLAAEILIQIQTRLEEAYLRVRHGDHYAAYAQSVHRWIGRQ